MNQLFLISQNEKLDHYYTILIDREKKTLVRKKLESSEILENEFLINFFLKKNLKIFLEESKNEFYQEELESFKKKTTIIKEDFNSQLSYFYFQYSSMNYTQCFLHNDTFDKEIFTLIDFLATKDYFFLDSPQTILYNNRKIDLSEVYPKIKSIKLESNHELFLFFDYNQIQLNNFETIKESECTQLNSKENTILTLNETIENEIFEKYNNKFISQFNSLLVEPPQSFAWSMQFKFCGNWCGPGYGGLNDPKCESFCKENLDDPSEECKICRPPINEVDGVCLEHDFCCARSQKKNSNICGSDYNSYDCKCHKNMVHQLANLKYHLFEDCNFIQKVIMELLFSGLKCMCTTDLMFESLWKFEEKVFSSSLDHCLPALMCT